MTNQITDTKLLENQILGNHIAGTPQFFEPNTTILNALIGR